jgi:hypothetical protein
MTDNTKIWDAVCKTDPAHTKPFSRSGGFKGTAIKPIWTVKRLTEQFGPVGMGWGMGEPSFTVVPSGEEILVYCTVTCWHTERANTFVGVGGDKVTALRTGKPFNDDEAFKKAFTDAVGNAFKFVGFGADVHMGQFEDSKYVQDVTEEFSEKPQYLSDSQRDQIQAICEAEGVTVIELCQMGKVKSLKEIPAADFGKVKRAIAVIKKQKEAS